MTFNQVTGLNFWFLLLPGSISENFLQFRAGAYPRPCAIAPATSPGPIRARLQRGQASCGQAVETGESHARNPHPTSVRHEFAGVRHAADRGDAERQSP